VSFAAITLLCCFSTSNTKGKRIFRYRLSPETFGYTLVRTQILGTVENISTYETVPECWSSRKTLREEPSLEQDDNIKTVSKNQGGRMLNGFIWFRIGSNAKIL
jgi:hypothetical protein